MAEFQKHEMEMPDLTHEGIFCPWGFPLQVRTNSAEVLRQCGEIWGRFQRRQETEPMQAEVWVVESDAKECPPAPTHRLISGVWVTVADADNYCAVDLECCKTRVVMTSAALSYPLYAQYFLLGMMACCVTTRHTTPVHAACVALDGKGVLLCGESGAGKSTLAYACARAGWTYISDDATLLLHDGKRQQVTGNCHLIRFRPSAAELFTELSGLAVTPRAAGKPSIEMPTSSIAGIHCEETALADRLVFLNRNGGSRAEIVPYSKDAARASLRGVLFAPGEARLAQYEAIEKLLGGEVLELRYAELDAAIARLRVLIQEGK